MPKTKKTFSFDHSERNFRLPIGSLVHVWYKYLTQTITSITSFFYHITESHRLKENSNDNNGSHHQNLSSSSSMILADPTSPRKRSQSYGPTSSTGSSETSNAASFILPEAQRPASASSSSASMMHQDPSFDPTTRIFTDDELRPQPILRKRKKQYVADVNKTEKYWEKRAKNNNAARRSREAKRTRENQV